MWRFIAVYAFVDITSRDSGQSLERDIVPGEDYLAVLAVTLQQLPVAVRIRCGGLYRNRRIESRGTSLRHCRRRAGDGNRCDSRESQIPHDITKDPLLHMCLSGDSFADSFIHVSPFFSRTIVQSSLPYCAAC